MSNPDLDDVIVSSIEDSEISEDPIPDDPSEPVEPSPSEPTTTEPTETKVETSEVSSPASKSSTPKAEPDEFEKKFGITQNAASGRENRIPYSRVKKITEKAVNDRVKELEATYTPKLTEFETKVKGYEEQLTRVAEFEKGMVSDPKGFLTWLSTNIPAYADLFKGLAAPTEAQEPNKAPSPDDMPQPDQKLSDGSMVYSLDGLKALNQWNRNLARKEAREEVMSEVSKRYAPIEEQWKAQEHLKAVVPQIQAQITEARTWPQFNENEADIVKALQANANLSLEGAYRQVVFPRLTSDRNKIREELMKEIKKAPVSTSAPSGSGRPSNPSGPRSLEAIIREAAESLK